MVTPPTVLTSTHLPSVYDPATNTGTVVSGTLSAIVDFKVDELEANIQTLEVGRLLGYKKNTDGKWVEVKTVGGRTHFDINHSQLLLDPPLRAMKNKMEVNRRDLIDLKGLHSKGNPK